MLENSRQSGSPQSNNFHVNVNSKNVNVKVGFAHDIVVDNNFFSAPYIKNM